MTTRDRYGPTDFHCERALNSWTDPLDLNAGWLTGLTDLNTEKDNVQQRIADYLTDLLSLGVSGIRVDAAKHMKPADLAAIFAKLKANMGGALPDDFIAWLEVRLQRWLTLVILVMLVTFVELVTLGGASPCQRRLARRCCWAARAIC